jgi:PKD repeat protein
MKYVIHNKSRENYAASRSHLFRSLIIISLLLSASFFPSCSSQTAPQAELRASISSGQAPLRVSFINDSKNASEFRWDFGDGATKTTIKPGQIVTHEYTEAGTHTVRLTAIANEDAAQASTAEIIITVKHGPIDNVISVPDSLDLACDQSHQMTAEAMDECDNPIPEAQITWKTPDDRAGTISSDGVFTAGTKAGRFTKGITVTASLNDQSAQTAVPVTILPGPLYQVKLSPPTLELAKGWSHQFIAEATDVYDNRLSEAKFTWKVAPGLGTITSSGMFTAGTQTGVFPQGVTVTVEMDSNSADATSSVTIVENQVFTAVHPSNLHSQAQIDAVKLNIQQNLQPWKDAYDELIAKANESLSHISQAVQDFYAPGYYVDSDASIAAKTLIHEDGSAAYFCALAYQLDESSNRIMYADKAVELLNSWAAINKTVSGTDGNEYMITGGMGFIQAADLVWNYNGWDSTDRDNFAAWVSTVFQNCGNALKSREANLGSWGTWGSISAACLVEDQATIDSDIDLMKNKIEDIIASDGHMIYDAQYEGKGIWYTYYGLAPLTAAFQVVWNTTGVDLFHYTSPNGRNIKMALDNLFYYSQHPDEWPYYEGELTNIPSADSWPGNLFMAMAGIFDEPSYEDWVTSAGRISDSTWWGSYHIAWYFPILMQPSPVKH